MCPTITVGSFFLDTKGPLFVHLFNNLHNFKPQQLQPQKRPKRKEKNRRPQPRNHTKNPHFFGTMRLFETFWIEIFPQRVPPSIFLMFRNTMDVKRSQRVPPFTFFGTVTLFKNLIKKIVRKFFHVSKGSPLHFFKIFCNQLEFHKARRVPLLNFEP